MKIPPNQLMRMLFLLTWAINETQGRAISYANSTASESAHPSPRPTNSVPDLSDAQEKQAVIFSVVVGLPLIGLLYCWAYWASRDDSRPPIIGRWGRRSITPSYDNSHNGDLELQPIVSLADTPGITETLKDFILAIEKSPLRVPYLNDEEAEQLANDHPEFCCTFSGDLMEIPVIWNKIKYDLKSLIKHQAQIENQDPATRIYIPLDEISPDHETRGKMIEAMMQALSATHPEGNNRFMPN